MRNLIAFISVLVGINSVVAQQNPISNFYQFNKYLLNPAEAGSQNKLEGTLSHRLQWRGIEGAPETSFLGVHGAINDNMGIGGRLIIDQSDILQQFSGAISYSYRIELAESKRIHFGVSALGMQNNIRFGDVKVTDQSDELLNSGDVEGLSFDAEAGITVEINQLIIGFSSAHLFESGINFELDSRNGTFDRARSFSSYISYSFDLTEDWKVEPMMMMRNQRVSSFQAEFNALFSWQEKLFLGAGYRDQAGFIAKAGFQITDYLLAAYAYEFSNTGIASYSNGSHEFMLGYRLKHATKKEPETKEELLTPLADEIKKEEKTQLEEKAVIETPAKEVQLEEENITEIKEKTVEEIEEKVEPIEGVVEKQEKTGEDSEKLTIQVVDPIIAEELDSSSETPEKTVQEENNKIDLSVFDEVIYFDFKKAALSFEGKQKLQKIVKSLENSPQVNLNLVGHTCNLGDNAINRIISTARANAVRDYLISKGINSQRLTVVPMLDRKPAVLNDTFNHRKQNRRVEFEPIVKP